MPSRALPHRSLLKSKCDEASVSRHVETKERCEHPKHHLGSLADTFFPPGRPRKGPRRSTMDFQQSLTVIAPSATRRISRKGMFQSCMFLDTSTRGPNRLQRPWENKLGTSWGIT